MYIVNNLSWNKQDNWRLMISSQIDFHKCSNSVTENAGSAACHHKSQTRQTGAGTKGKRFYSGATWENGELPFQRPSPLLAQGQSSYLDREGSAFFYLVLPPLGPVHSSF